MDGILGENLYEGIGYEALACPACDSFSLQRSAVQVFGRDQNPATGVHVTVSGAKVSVDLQLDGNPSKQGDGLAIEFRCDQCRAVSVLGIAQGKIQTHVTFNVRREAGAAGGQP